MHQLIFLLSILTHPLNPLHKYHHHDTSLNDPSHGERRPKACSYTWNTKIQRTGEEPHLSTSQSLIWWEHESHTLLPWCVSTSHWGRQRELRSLSVHPTAEQFHNRSHPAVTTTPRAPSGHTSSFPSLRSGAVPSHYWKLKAQIYAMTRPSHS